MSRSKIFVVRYILGGLPAGVSIPLALLFFDQEATVIVATASAIIVFACCGAIYTSSMRAVPPLRFELLVSGLFSLGITFVSTALLLVAVHEGLTTVGAWLILAYLVLVFCVQPLMGLIRATTLVREDRRSPG